MSFVIRGIDFSSIPTKEIRVSPFIFMRGKLSLRPSSGFFPPRMWAYNDGYSARTLRELLAIVETNSERIVRAWNDHFGD